MHKNSATYQLVQDPAQDTRGANVLWGFYIKLCPPGISGADGDDLENTKVTDRWYKQIYLWPLCEHRKLVCTQNNEENVSNQNLLWSLRFL